MKTIGLAWLGFRGVGLVSRVVPNGTEQFPYPSLKPTPRETAKFARQMVGIRDRRSYRSHSLVLAKMPATVEGH